MTLSQNCSTIVKQWSLIVICLVAGGLGAYIGSKLMIPLYQSTTLVQITIPAGSSKEVTAAAKVHTQLFEIDVLDPSPTRTAAIANAIVTTFIKLQAQLTQQNSAQDGRILVIAQSAQPALKPARPHTLLSTGLGLAAGLLLGMLLAVLFEQLGTRVRTPEILSQLFGWLVLATVWKANPIEEVINPKESDASVESHRILRTNSGFSAIDKPAKSLVVTSAFPHDGKSAIAANLAIVMARAGTKTPLVDADLRRPTVHEVFKLSADKKGLSNALLALSTPTTDGASLSQDPVIPDTPLTLSSASRATRTSIALANCRAGPVICDTPPLPGLSDASILASKVDGTRAKKGSLRQMQALLVQAGAHVLGCVVNKQRSSSDKLYFYFSSAVEQDGMNKHNAKKLASSLSPATADVLGKHETPFRLAYLRRRCERSAREGSAKNKWQSEEDMNQAICKGISR